MIQREPVIPGHYRLSDESWAEITEAFKNGATARELAVKWRVSMGSVYGHARKAGVGKKTTGNERAVEHARAVEAREAARGPVEWETQRQQTAALFSAAIDPDGPMGPAELSHPATVASGRAMRKGMWNEAKALAGLAESYTRLQERKRESELTPENAPLGLIVDLIFGSESRWFPRVSLIGARDNDPDTPIKHKFWQRHEARGKAQERDRQTRWSKAMGEYGRGVVDGRRGAETYWRTLAEAQGVVLPAVQGEAAEGEPHGPPEY